MKKLTEEEIDALLERFIQKYIKVISPVADSARNAAVDRLRTFLRNADTEDFRDGEEFADKLVSEIKTAYGANFASRRAIGIVKKTTESIYRFYRLKDATPFAGKSPIKLRFGGADTRTIKFFGDVDNWYFSKFVDNRNTGLREFFKEAYLKNGAALFGRETTEELDDFRRAAGDKLKNINDRAIKAIVQTSTQRARNWGHIGSLSQAKFKLARIVAILDSRTTEICRSLDGKQFRVGPAQKTIERLNQLEPGEFAAEMYESNVGKAISKDPVNFVNSFLEEDGKTIGDDLVETGRGFPPYHINCRTRVEGVFE